MSRPTIKIHNADTGEITEIAMNDTQYEQYLKDVAEFDAKKTAEETKAAQKAALLERLGITQDEANLLLS